MAYTLKSTIEEIVESNSENIKFLMERGIRCIRCGEPIWGTFEDACKQKGFKEKEIYKLLEELNDLNK